MSFGLMNATPFSTSSPGPAGKPGLGVLTLSPLLLAFAVVQSGCGSGPPALQVGEVSFSEEDLLGYSPDRRTRLAEITAVGLAVARGELLELGEPTLYRRRQETLLDYLREEVLLQAEGIGDDVLEARYLTDPEYELTVRHLVVLSDEVDPEETRDASRRRAEAALERIQAGEPFPEVAGEVSQEPGAAERGGLLQPGRRGSWVDEFWEAASALEVGEVSPVVASPYGFHVIKLDNRNPVPFQESRRSVVQEVVRLLPPQDLDLQAWSDSVTQGLTVDTAALSMGWETASGSLFLLANDWLRSQEAETALGSWPGGALTGRDLRSFLLAQNRTVWESLSQQGWVAVLRVAREATRVAQLASVAGSRGLRITPETEAQIEGEWLEILNGWAAAFGFREGMRPEEVRVRALAGASSTVQSVRIARDGVRAWGPLLLAAYPLGP
jgi:hypothetical protein